jgi:DNA replication protein DnaD
MSGTVNISRGIWSDTAFKDQPFTEREAFMWMVMEASWKPREKRVGSVVVQLNRGQLAASVRFMADAWNWQKSTVDRFLKRLENRDMIGTASGTGVNVITICKYNDYQSAPSDSGTPKKQKTGQQRTRS